jgi:hypothetical protein
MKTLTVELDDEAYPKLLAFLQRLAADQHAVLVSDDDVLSEAERTEVAAIRERLAAGDESEFEDWADLRRNL